MTLQEVFITTTTMPNPTVELKEYFFYAPYNSANDYDNGLFTVKIDDNIERTFFNKIITFLYNDNKYRFVVAEEVVNPDELESLKPHCQCVYHTSFMFNPFKYTYCLDCVGCLHSKYNQAVINKTRKYIQDNIYPR